jgi:hypothetical protein
LNVNDEAAEQPVVAGFPPRRLTATPNASRHGLGVRFDHHKPGGTCHFAVWLKAAPLSKYETATTRKRASRRITLWICTTCSRT